MTTAEMRRQIIKYCNDALKAKATKSKIIKIGGNEILVFYIDKKYYKKQNIFIIVNLNGIDEEMVFSNSQYNILQTFEGMKEIQLHNILKKYMSTSIQERKRTITKTVTIH